MKSLIPRGEHARLGSRRSAFAQTYVKITGSTAFRKATYFAICNSLNNPKAAFIGTVTADLSGVTQAVIRGTLKSGTSAGQDVVYQLAWAGSVGGVQVLDDSSQTSIPGVSFAGGATWMKPDITGGNTLTAVTVGASSITGATPIASGSAAFEAWSQPQVSNSDSFQSSTPWNSTVLKDTTRLRPAWAWSIHWVKGLKDPDIDAASSGAYERFTNFTQQQGPLLLVNGAVPLSQFTGNTADSAINVVLVGRNSDSGTRSVQKPRRIGLLPDLRGQLLSDDYSRQRHCNDRQWRRRPVQRRQHRYGPEDPDHERREGWR